MRKVTTILCSIAFMISGIMLAISASDPSPQYDTGYKTMSAATIPEIKFPSVPNIQSVEEPLNIPEDLVRDFAKKKGWTDTVYITKPDTVVKLVTKTKWKKVPVPKPQVDTIKVPVYYLATQVGNKESPTGECISVYEVHKVDEICPETTNSSVELINMSDVDVGE